MRRAGPHPRRAVRAFAQPQIYSLSLEFLVGGQTLQLGGVIDVRAP